MDNKAILLKEIDQFPHEYLKEVLDFIRRVTLRRRLVTLDIARASEFSLRTDWLFPEEDEAWRGL